MYDLSRPMPKPTAENCGAQSFCNASTPKAQVMNSEEKMPHLCEGYPEHHLHPEAQRGPCIKLSWVVRGDGWVQDVAAPPSQTWREPNIKINAAIHRPSFETTAPSASTTGVGAGVGGTSSQDAWKLLMLYMAWGPVNAFWIMAPLIAPC